MSQLPSSEEHNELIGRAVDEYLRCVDQGEVPEFDEFVQRYPQVREVLKSVIPALLLARSNDDSAVTHSELVVPSADQPTQDRAFVGREEAQRAQGKRDPRDLHVETGMVIGNYKLRQQIGQGGMGTVWMADQEKPVRRRVALKLIKDGLDNQQVIARFEAERQALAMMDHQHIAKVLDAGTTATGSPYFVMELVQGIPITEYCDRNRLTPNERLSLFVPVCKAVQHAHQKGIVHRDLKPSNVLVCVYDGEPTPKVIDFGLAKALQHQTQLTDKTMFTEFGRVVGTVQYMSPEQATMDALDIDTRTDIYSLGVMLYELIAGSTPIEKDTLQQNALFTVLELIREKDPPRPSHRLSSSSEQLLTISDQRQIHPAKLQQILRGDLDWIIMKALEKDRTRRYETANNLAEDIRHYLDGESVEARPPSKAYKLSKFVKKNRGLVAALLAITALLIAGISGTTRFAIRAESARVKADNKTTEAINEKKRAQRESRRARDAETRLALAMEKTTEQKTIAEQQRDRAESELFRAEQLLYASRIATAYQEWEAHNVTAAWESLNECRWDRRSWEHAYIYSLLTGERVASHPSSVTSVDMSSDGRILTSADRSGQIRIWNASNELLRTIDAHQSAIRSVSVSPDGSKIFSGGKRAKIWLTETGQELFAMEGEETDFFCSAFSPDGKWVAATGCFHVLKLWNVEDGSLMATFTGSTACTNALAFNSDGSRLVTACLDGVLRIWDVATKRMIGSWETCDEATPKELRSIYSVAFSNNDEFVVTGDMHSTVKLWRAKNGDELARLSSAGSDAWVVDVEFSPDGTTLVSASDDQTVNVWDIENARLVRSFREAATSIAFRPDGREFISGGWDGAIRVWPVGNGKLPAAVPAGTACSIVPDGTHVVIAKDDATFGLLDIETKHEVKRLRYNPNGAATTCVSLSPDGRRIAYGSSNHSIYVCDLASGTELCELQGHSGEIWSMAFDADGRFIASVSRDRTIRIWMRERIA